MVIRRYRLVDDRLGNLDRAGERRLRVHHEKSLASPARPCERDTTRDYQIFDRDKAAHKVTAEVRKLAGRWLRDVERRLEDREWIAHAEFTAADIMMAGVLRSIRKTDLMDPYPRIKVYYARALARPAWQRTLRLYAERLGVNVDDIR